jgi:hypothetical protein
MKVMKIAQMVLRLAFVLALILGIIFWVDQALPATNEGIKGLHMLLGIILVLSLWTVGLAQGFVKGGGNFGLAIGTFIVGLLVAIVGLWQETWKAGVTSTATLELINSIHLLLGIIAVGMGEMVVSRTKKRVAQAAASESVSTKA